MTFGVQMKIAQMEKINKSKMFEMEKNCLICLKWKKKV